MELTIKLTTEQIIDFIQQLPGKEKLTVVQRPCKRISASPHGTDEVS